MVRACIFMSATLAAAAGGLGLCPTPLSPPPKVEVKGRVAIDRTLLSLTCSAMVVTGAHKCTDGAVGGRVEG